MTSPEFREERKEYKIREATPADAAAIARIQYDSWLATYPNEDVGISKEDLLAQLGELTQREEKWKKTFAEPDPQRKIFVATENQKIVGFCRIQKGEHENNFIALYLDKAHEGRGVASKLIKKIFDDVGEDKPAKLEVATYNHHAKAIYEHYGFKESEQTTHDVNGKSMPITVMRRPAKE